MQGRVPQKSELYWKRASEICIGGLWSLWQNVHLCVRVVRHYEAGKE